MKRKKNFNYSLHYFRGIAIMAIMLTHVWLFPGNKETHHYNIYFAIKETLFDGSTIYFIVISGFLLHHLKHKFETSKFYLSKIKYVIAPYIFLSVCILILLSFFGQYKNSFNEFITNIPAHLLEGTATRPFWYIPFIIPIFIIAPIVQNIKDNHLKKILPILLLIPLLGTRSGITITLQTYFYFFPIYLLGVYASMNFKEILAISKKYFGFILVAFISLSLVTFYFFWNRTDISYSIFSLKDGIVYLKCMCAALLLINLCDRIAHKDIRILNTLANYSFALYFIHDFISYRIFFISRKISDHFNFIGSVKIIWGVVWAFIVIMITLSICISAKKLLGKYSRYITGA